MPDPRERAAGVLGPGKLRQLEEARLTVVDSERILEAWMDEGQLYRLAEGKRIAATISERQLMAGDVPIRILPGAWHEEPSGDQLASGSTRDGVTPEDSAGPTDEATPERLRALAERCADAPPVPVRLTRTRALEGDFTFTVDYLLGRVADALDQETADG